MSQTQAVKALLEEINQEMVRLDLWQSTLPSKEALASTEPFCCDTLTFCQWLEFVLLPKMTMLIDSELPLPTAFEILPMAQESWKKLDTDMSALLALIAKLDAQFS